MNKFLLVLAFGALILAGCATTQETAKGSNSLAPAPPGPVATANANLTPSVVPFTYSMKTYIQGYLDKSVPDDRVNSLYGNSSDIIAGGRKVTSTETFGTPLVWKGMLTDPVSGKKYAEDERYYFYAYSSYDTSAKQVKAKNGQVAYEANFTPIQFCTDATPSNITTSEACPDQFETQKHGLKVKLLGSDWTLTSMTVVGTGVSALVKQVVLVKGNTTLTLNDGQTINSDNTQWSVAIVGGGTAYGPSIAQIQLKRLVIDDLAEGQIVPFINKPQLRKLQFRGLEALKSDTISMGTGTRNFPLSSTDTVHVDISYVRISSSNNNAFQFPNDSVSTVYLVVGKPKGQIQVGVILYQNTQGYFSKYYDIQWDGTNNYVPYTYATGKTSYIRFNKAGINAGNPDMLQKTIFIPELVWDTVKEEGAMVFDVGQADAVNPIINYPTGTAYIYYQYPYSKTVSTGGTAYEAGLITMRGSLVKELGSTNATIQYAQVLRHALYRFTG